MLHKILLLDDNETNLKILDTILKKEGHETVSFTSGHKALLRLQEGDISLILSDISMPEMDGFEFCFKVKNTESVKHIPLIFISALDLVDDVVEGFNVGGVDYITKPFNAQEVKMRVKAHLELFDLQHNLQKKVEEQVEILAATQMETIFSLAKLAQSRDDDTGLHLERVQEYCRLLVLELKENSLYGGQISDTFVENIYHASPLHDIGKVGIEDAILLKKGKLTTDEFERMKTHTTIGADTLVEVNKKFGFNSFIQMGIVIARSHHEKFDGTGYPQGLSGSDIPLAARVMAIADVYDALRAKRTYKEPFSHEMSCAIINEGRGKHFDPVIVDAFNVVEKKFEAICSEAIPC